MAAIQGELRISGWENVWITKPIPMTYDGDTCVCTVNGVKGFLLPGDVKFMFTLGTELPKDGVYLEIGSWMGLSSITVANALLSRFNFNAQVFCVDTWEGSMEHKDMPEIKGRQLYSIFEENVRNSRMDHFIRAVRGDSVQIGKSWDGPLADIIFVDGDHSFQGCYADIRAWLPRLKPGGRMLGHDATPGEGGVREALDRFSKETGIRYRITEPPDAHYAWEFLLQ